MSRPPIHTATESFDWLKSQSNVSVHFQYRGTSPVAASQGCALQDENYAFALEDLRDLGDPDADWGGDIAPEVEALRYAALVLHEVSGAYPAPDLPA